MSSQQLSARQELFVASARVAHLASSSRAGRPHVVPVCFQLMRGRLYVGIDSKPKSVDAMRLRRVRNILDNPSVALLVDRYDEDWNRLGYVLISARATLDVPEPERREAIRALRAKYRQYERMLRDDAPVLRISPVAVSSWGDLTPWPPSAGSGQ